MCICEQETSSHTYVKTRIRIPTSDTGLLAKKQAQVESKVAQPVIHPIHELRVAQARQERNENDPERLHHHPAHTEAHQRACEGSAIEGKSKTPAKALGNNGGQPQGGSRYARNRSIGGPVTDENLVRLLAPHAAAWRRKQQSYDLRAAPILLEGPQGRSGTPLEALDTQNTFDATGPVCVSSQGAAKGNALNLLARP